jgi:anti-sigma regulatory factor (Ser/Thr protein kinase)
MEGIPELVEFVSTQAWEGGFPDARIKEIGLAITETLGNIVRFACADGAGEITIKCDFDETRALVIDIIDSGKNFNMLVASLFPETTDFVEQGPAPTLRQLKKTVKNIEYRRDGMNNRNILSLLIPR